jgi:hypothetical protein
VASTPEQTLSVPELYALARRAGLSPANAVTAAAIAEAESSGRSWVTSPNPDGGTNVGPWQLDTPGGGGAGYTVEELQNPWTNAQAMAKASKNGTDWSTWATYASGAYDAFLTSASQAAAKESSGGSSWIDSVLHDIEAPFKAIGSGAESTAGSVAGSVLSLPSDVTDFFDDAKKFADAALWFVNPANWVRILSGVAGFALLIAALVFLAKAAA